MIVFVLAVNNNFYEYSLMQIGPVQVACYCLVNVCQDPCVCLSWLGIEGGSLGPILCRAAPII
jgi:hypothetical protein